ncbi:MAG: hypothetical protein RL196_1334, partial [Actinomycetota bacterium]
YIGALGEGFNTTISVAATGSTATAQIVDMNGSVVATIDIPAAGNATGPTSFQSFDEYGVPETTTIANSTIQNFGWAGTANRQTEATGLILMGARVYNPVTGQFTSPDPIPGGNETTYTYPNDPINSTDYTGCMPWESWGEATTFVFGIALVAMTYTVFCAVTAGVGCLVVLAAAGAISTGLSTMATGYRYGHRGSDLSKDYLVGSVVGAITTPISGVLRFNAAEGMVKAGWVGSKLWVGQRAPGWAFVTPVKSHVINNYFGKKKKLKNIK